MFYHANKFSNYTGGISALCVRKEPTFQMLRSQQNFSYFVSSTWIECMIDVAFAHTMYMNCYCSFKDQMVLFIYAVSHILHYPQHKLLDCFHFQLQSAWICQTIRLAAISNLALSCALFVIRNKLPLDSGHIE